MTRAQRVNYLASTAGLLAQSYGKVVVMPNGMGAVTWSDGPLIVILWADAEIARVDLFRNGRKVLATTWHPGAARHEAIAFRRGSWEQELELAGRGMVEGLARDWAGTTLH
jgi:hypothetical protein